MGFAINALKSEKSVIWAIAFSVILFSAPVFGQQDYQPLPPEAFPPDEFSRAKVVEISADQENLKLKILSGPEADRELILENNRLFFNDGLENIKIGETVVLVKNQVLDEVNYYIADKYRLPAIATILVLFFILAVAFGGMKGFTSILGLLFSIFILAAFVVPRILAGDNPLLISLAGSLMIVFISLYLAHGFNKRTSIALVSTLLTLGIAALLAIFFVSFAKLFGVGSEEAFYLQIFSTQELNLRGLLLGAIIIGALGVLDDVTTSQTAAVEEIKNADPSLSFSELYRRGLNVGREHITALVNTLALAYAGASLPLFLLFSLNNTRPLWAIINDEVIAEEIIRTLVGSTALLFAVPIATFFAAYFYSRE
jgi:uncharacterized membrane protein